MSANQAKGNLPGNPMMWILIGSEIAVFGAALIGFAGARIANPDLFSAGQMTLSKTAGAINTAVLLTSGLFAALAVEGRKDGRRGRARLALLLSALLGCVFAAVKIAEYKVKLQAGIGIETNTFYTLYFLITGFHLLHVFAGIFILALVAWWDSIDNLETGTAFWHMVDMIWVLIFPVVYIIG